MVLSTERREEVRLLTLDSMSTDADGILAIHKSPLSMPHLSKPSS